MTATEYILREKSEEEDEADLLKKILQIRDEITEKEDRILTRKIQKLKKGIK